MKDIDIVKAIRQLKPTAQFSFNSQDDLEIDSEDYLTIKWDLLEGDAPTWQEVQEAHLAVQQAESEAKAEAETKKAAAEAKLAALGLTSDDLKALGL